MTTDALNIGDAEQVAAVAKRHKAGETQADTDFRDLMQSPVGRRFIWRMFGVTHIFESSFTGNSTTFFKEGERNVGLQLMSDLNRVCPDLYFVMVRENSPKP